MKYLTVLLILAAFAWSAVVSEAETSGASIVTTRLTQRLYLLTTDQGEYTTNTVASVGEDGLLLVDTQGFGDAEALKNAVEAFGAGNPKFIINTHRHVEHVGGNAIFGRDPVVIAHDLVPAKLRSGSYLFDEFPDATFPDVTFSDSMKLWFNGEEIRLIAMPGSHDDNEIIVHFVSSKVVHLSSLVNGFNFPSVDKDGDALMFKVLVGRAVALLPEDVVIVSGHNGTGTKDDLRAYYEMLVATEEVVRTGLADGKHAPELKSEEALNEWAEYAGSYVSVDEWTDTLVAAMQPHNENKPSIYEPMYDALKSGGIETATALYLELKSDHADKYEFTEVDLLVMGDKLLDKGRAEQAVALLELSLAEYPEGAYAWYVNYDLALAYRALGDREAATSHCRTALRLKPDNPMIAGLLAEIESPG